MIPEFVAAFERGKDKLREVYRSEGDAQSYTEVVKRVIQVIADELDDYDKPDPERIQVVDFGHYQGTQVFVIGASGYQPWQHWACLVGYGSCSGCDTLQAIQGYRWDTPPSEQEIDQYLTLSLHIVQRLKPLDGSLV